MVLLKRLEKSTIKLTQVTDRLAEAEETITKIEAQLKNSEGKEADSLRKVGKAVTDSIKIFAILFLVSRRKNKAMVRPINLQ